MFWWFLIFKWVFLDIIQALLTKWIIISFLSLSFLKALITTTVSSAVFDRVFNFVFALWYFFSWLLLFYSKFLCQVSEINIVFAFHVVRVSQKEQVVFDEIKLDILFHVVAILSDWDNTKSIFFGCNNSKIITCQ